jgi:hypothetical protein
MTHTHCIMAVALLTCATSGCSSKAGAQTPAAPSRMLTADTDANQLVSGAVTVPGTTGDSSAQFQKLIDGQFVLTDFFFSGNYSVGVVYAVPSGQDCTIPDPVSVLDGTNGRVVGYSGLTGARLVIKGAEELCAFWMNTGTRSGISWNGFKPY